MTPTIAQTATVTDPLSKATRSASDALGRVTAVIEDPTGAALMTQYGYNQMGYLTSVKKCSAGQTRTFPRDSLDRLGTVNNPESGKYVYSYTAAQLSNLKDAAGYSSDYVYDGLNRLKSVSHARGQASPDISYTYSPVGDLTGTVKGSVATSTNYKSGSPSEPEHGANRQWAGLHVSLHVRFSR